MTGRKLFWRFMLRFLIGFAVAVLCFTPLVHLFQLRVINAEWQDDLRQEAVWAARHFRLDSSPAVVHAWRTMHGSVRMTFFDENGKLTADSHPEREVPDLAALRAGKQPVGYHAAIHALEPRGWLVMSRPWVPGFPHGLRWELVIAASLVVVVVYLLLYPLVRSISTTLGQLGQLAGEVSAGHFGKTLDVHRKDELGDLVRSFNEMSERLAEAERSNTRLLHDVSHELRSPLGRIQVMAETSLLRPAEAEECVRGIRQEVALLDRLVEDLLQVARFESDSQSYEIEGFSLLDWTRETGKRLERRARAEGIDWATVLPATDVEAHGDAQRLAQALGNLADNSIRALAGRPTPRIELRVQATAHAWSLTLADNGPGIPSRDLPLVFRRFYRVGTDRGRERGGVGLGLSLVQAIVETHGGAVQIDCPEDGGTVVRLTVPLAGPERRNAP